MNTLDHATAQPRKPPDPPTSTVLDSTAIVPDLAAVVPNSDPVLWPVQAAARSQNMPRVGLIWPQRVLWLDVVGATVARLGHSAWLDLVATRGARRCCGQIKPARNLFWLSAPCTLARSSCALWPNLATIALASSGRNATMARSSHNAWPDLIAALG